jgi:hypothetical protein
MRTVIMACIGIGIVIVGATTYGTAVAGATGQGGGFVAEVL